MAKLGYQTLRENVLQEIRAKIMRRELTPGMRIIEQELSDELGVSRGPIREELRQLEQEGLIEYTRHVGCSVKEVTIRDLYEIYLLRSTYEILAVRLVDGRYSEEDMDRMEKILETMKHLDNYEDVVKADLELHYLIVEKAGLERITKAWSDLDYGSVISCYIAGFDEERTIGRQYRFHRELVDVCRTKETDEICRVIRSHYMSSVQYFMEQEEAQDRGAGERALKLEW